MNKHEEKAAPVVPASAYMNIIARRVALRLWWLVAAALVAVAAGAVHDWRFAIVGLMLLLIVFPMALCFVVLAYSAKPAVVALMSLERVDIDDDTLEVYGHDGNLLRVIRRGDVRSLSFSVRYVTVTTGSRPGDVLLVPREMLSQRQLAALAAFQPEVEM